MTFNVGCNMCGSTIVDVDHILWGCSKARLLWSKIIPQEAQIYFFKDIINDWFMMNLKNNQS